MILHRDVALEKQKEPCLGLGSIVWVCDALDGFSAKTPWEGTVVQELTKKKASGLTLPRRPEYDEMYPGRWYALHFGDPADTFDCPANAIFGSAKEALENAGLPGL